MNISMGVAKVWNVNKVLKVSNVINRLSDVPIDINIKTNILISTDIPVHAATV